LGDTVRVSLTEDPEYEFGPCNRLTEIAKEHLGEKTSMPYIDTRDITSFSRRTGDTEDTEYLNRDGSVFSVIDPEMLKEKNVQYLYKELGCKTVVGMPLKDIATVDSVLIRSIPQDAQARKALKRLADANIGIVVPSSELKQNPWENAISLAPLSEATSEDGAIIIDGTESEELLNTIPTLKPLFILLQPTEARLYASRRVFEVLKKLGDNTPVIHYFASEPCKGDTNELALQLGTSIGSLLTDGNGDGIMIDNSDDFTLDFLRTTSFSLLQGCRMRNIKTEFVSCPSCGRTLFDLQETTARIQEATGHLPGVTVAVMGCIVNGPGEMADADFGYVGTIPGKVDLYYGKEVVKKSIPNDNAVDELVELIKDYGMWKDKEEEEVEEEEVAVAV